MICESFYKTIGLDIPIPLGRSDRVKFNRFVFEKYFVPRMEYCKKNGSFLELSIKDIKTVENYVTRKVESKKSEWDSKDNINRQKRVMTGACIEYGLYRFFNKENEFDDSIVDNPNKRNHPDLLPSGILCDIKGSSISNVPLVFKSTRFYTCKMGRYNGQKFRCANLIGITDKKSVWFLGIASPRILNEYSDENLVMMSTNSSKTGFYGVEHLEDLPFKWEDFKKTCAINSLIV